MVSQATETAIKQILRGAVPADLESDLLDFKQPAGSDKATVKLVIEAALCFANASGGIVILGVRDRTSGADAVVGTDLAKEEVQRRVYDSTRPPLLVDVAEFEVTVHTEPVETRRVLEIRVPQSPEIHSDSKGRAPRRVGTDCLPLDPIQQRMLSEERRGVDWSSMPSGRATSDLVAGAVELARERLQTFSDQRRELALLRDTDLLRALGVISDTGELLRAGEILFCETKGITAPRLVYQYRSTAGGEPSAVERFDGPVISSFEAALKLVAARRQLTPVTLPTGQQITVEDFPELAVREAVANALIHRDYHVDGSVVVEQSPDVFVVASPGPLVSGVTPQNILTHPSKPRNALLAKATRILGLAEEVGRGVDRMYREMLRSGRDAPTIQSSLENVRVTLVGGAPNTQIARYIAQLPAEERDDVDTMLVLFSLCSKRTVDASEMALVLQRTEDEAEAVLRRLAGPHVGMIESTRESARLARRTYRLQSTVLQELGTAVKYQRRTTDEIDRKLVAHVREYGRITNKTVRNLLDVKVDRAASILGDLVSREILVKTSQAQRGPSVEYGPGPKFPARTRGTRRSRETRSRKK